MTSLVKLVLFMIDIHRQQTPYRSNNFNPLFDPSRTVLELKLHINNLATGSITRLLLIFYS